MYMIGFPLLLIPLAIINIFVFLMPGVALTSPLVHVRLLSNEVWALTFSDALIALGVLLLIVEVGKAARAGAKLIFDHFMSMLVLGVALAEFLMLKPFANSTMFVICALCVADVVASLAVQMRRRMSAKAPRGVQNEVGAYAAPASEPAPPRAARQEPAMPPQSAPDVPNADAAPAHEPHILAQSGDMPAAHDSAYQGVGSSHADIAGPASPGGADAGADPHHAGAAQNGAPSPSSSPSLDDAIADLRAHRTN